MELSHHRKKSHLSRYFYCLSPLHYYQSVWSTSQLTDLFMDPDSLLSHLYLTPRPLCCFNGGLFTVWRLLVCFCPSGLSGRDFLSLCPPRWRGVPLRWGREGGRGSVGTSEPLRHQICSISLPLPTQNPRCLQASPERTNDSDSQRITEIMWSSFIDLLEGLLSIIILNWD